MKTIDTPETSVTPDVVREPVNTGPVTIGELGSLAFFAGMSAKHLEDLRAHTKYSYFEPGDLLLRQGDLANRFYVVVSGRVAIEHEVKGERICVQEVGPGEPAGFSWSFTPEKLHFNARAIEPVKAVFFYGTLLREDCELDPSLGLELMTRAGRTLVQRMEGLIEILKKRV